MRARVHLAVDSDLLFALQVRSATLDTWTPEQVFFVSGVGNERANAYWESGRSERERWWAGQKHHS